MGKQATCEERITFHLNCHRLGWQKLKRINKTENWDAIEAYTERKREELLAHTKFTVHRIDYSTGGPADWFEVFQDGDGEIFRIVYHFSDWFDHAEKQLGGQDFKDAKDFLSTVCFLGSE